MKGCQRQGCNSVRNKAGTFEIYINLKLYKFFRLIIYYGQFITIIFANLRFVTITLASVSFCSILMQT